MSELVVRNETEMGPAQSPVAWAIANNVSPEQMLQYYQLDREIKADAARNAFNTAFSDFKAEAVSIVKNVTVKDGPLKDKRYADLFGVVSVVTPVLSKHGLSHSWKLTKDEPEWMEVTCIIRHALGHSESVSMGAKPDAGPGRNAIQARGSAKSYLERYTLLAATGMAASGQDNDGNGEPEKRMDEGVLDEWLTAIKGSGDHDQLKGNYLKAVATARQSGDAKAEAQIVAAKNARFRQIGPQK